MKPFPASKIIFDLPCAPYHEHHIQSALLDLFMGIQGISCRQDEFGNLHLHYRYRPGKRAPLLFVAHMDHPGFSIPSHRRCLKFLGGVHDDYFKGAEIVYHHHRDTTPLGTARIKKIFKKESHLFADAGKIPRHATFAIWNLPRAKESALEWQARSCDDLCAVSSLITLFHQLSLTKARTEVYALITRAEEVGFHGTLAAISAGTLPRVPVISLEASQAKGFAIPGNGVILRVGDRASVFDDALTRWMQMEAEDVSKQSPDFKIQRRLMSGGTCEGTAFQRHGFQTGALCLPLINYHNMGSDQKIRHEKVRLEDWINQNRLLYHLASEASPIADAGKKLDLRLKALKQQALKNLYPR